MKRILFALSLLLAAWPGMAQQSDPQVKKVHVIFKTHLDIGFTELSSKVEQRYIDEFIPKAIAVSEQLRRAGGEERYVWTTGSWLIATYLEQASPEAVRQLEQAIRRGDIVWNGVPYTVESESMNKELLAGILKLSQRLDERFSKQTVAAKMTDVPGHTRGIVPVLADAGITFLQIGVNSAATVPAVAPVCLWRDPSGKEVVLMYQKTYGEDMILPGSEVAVSVNFTNDNKGPHTVERVKNIYRELHKRYPNAQIVASSLNAVAAELEPMRQSLPVLTSEIGDTWIYGYGSSPLRMARYRELCRLYAAWIRSGALDADSDAAVDFAIRLGMIAEHTWGADVKVFLKNWDKYEFDSFNAARGEAPFRYMEQSWKELDDNIDKAIALLPEVLRREARQAIAPIGRIEPAPALSGGKDARVEADGSYAFEHKKIACNVGELAYQSFSNADYLNFQNNYLTRKVQWAIEDNGKPGLDKCNAHRVTLVAQMQDQAAAKTKAGRQIAVRSAFPADKWVDACVLPQEIRTLYTVAADGKSMDLTVTIEGKPANRLPEAYWLSLRPANLTGVIAEKVGSRVDLMDVVEGGNRQMHGFDGYVDLVTRGGTLRVTSPDALLVVVGARDGLNYSEQLPNLKEGVHICLYNNLWGTNFSMWWEGSVSYRFHIEVL